MYLFDPFRFIICERFIKDSDLRFQIHGWIDLLETSEYDASQNTHVKCNCTFKDNIICDTSLNDLNHAD